MHNQAISTCHPAIDCPHTQPNLNQESPHPHPFPHLRHTNSLQPYYPTAPFTAHLNFFSCNQLELLACWRCYSSLAAPLNFCLICKCYCNVNAAVHTLADLFSFHARCLQSLDWKMDWNSGMNHGMDYWILKKTSNNIFPWQYQSLLCGCLLTNLLIFSSALYWPAFVHPPPTVFGSKSHGYLMSFNGRILYIASSLPSTKETHLRSDRVRG